METAREAAEQVLTKEKPMPATLRELRHEAGWKLGQAAAKAGLHPARLSEIERGLRGPSADELQRLAYLFGPLEVALVVREARA